MLPREERRRIAQIEQGLSEQDPAFADRLRNAGLPRRRVSGWLVLGVLAAVVAVVCVLLGEAVGFFLSAVLAAALLSSRTWSVVAA